MRRLIGLLVLALVPAGAPATGLCLPELSDHEPSPRALRFGVTAAGQVFSSQRDRIPESVPQTLAALDRLRGSEPLLVRVNRVFYRDGEFGLARAESLARRYADAGHEVTLQLRYGPFGALVDPSPAGFASWVREVVERVGATVSALEVTNEPNLTSAPDNSDGAFAGVTDALAQGVIAAADERDRRGLAHLRIGFNWFHETGPVDEQAFWSALAASGGTALALALDWVGLNAYPGTYDFAAVPPGMEADDLLSALDKLRRCYLPMIGVGDTTPIRIIENGYPDGFARAPLMADALERMVRAAHDHAGTFNVTHHLWFTLRDVNSGALANESRYGLLKDDYTPKPAFDRYEALISELG